MTGLFCTPFGYGDKRFTNFCLAFSGWVGLRSGGCGFEEDRAAAVFVGERGFAALESILYSTVQKKFGAVHGKARKGGGGKAGYEKIW